MRRTPPREDAAQGQPWSQVLMMGIGGMAGGMFMLANPRPVYAFAGAVLMVATIGGTLTYAVTSRRSGARRGERRRATYLQHLDRVRDTALDAADRHRAALVAAHPEPAVLPSVAQGPRTWERRPADADFLDLRLGTGTVAPAGRPRADPAPDQEDDAVLAAAAARLDRTLAWSEAVPVAVALHRTRRVVVAGAGAAGTARCLLAQAVVWHCPEDVRVLVAAAPDRVRDWEWTKWLPHSEGLLLSSGALEERLLAEVSARASTLAGRARDPRGGVLDPVGPHLLVVCDGVVPDHDGSMSVLLAGESLGVTVVELRGPGAGPVWWTDVLLDVTADGWVEPTGDRAPQVREPVVADAADVELCTRLARRLAPCRTREETVAGDADDGGGRDLAAVLGVADLAAHRPSDGWGPRSRADRLRVPFATGPDGRPVLLDLKESAQGGAGPHGMLVGATGSGKSELLRTLVTALALTHPPEDLAMALVDFKGGATFSGLSRLPHVAGVVTNLQGDTTLVGRTTDALAGELERRQELLHTAGVSSLDDYRALPPDPARIPLPALLVVVDEFTELLIQQPDLAELFAAIGRLGRSLGVHLLLASQRLDEGKMRGLQSHLSYRIALRTFSSSDSVSAIGSRDAYHLPHSPGAGYVQAGPGELRRFDAVHVSGRHLAPGAAVRDDRPLVLPFPALPVPVLPAAAADGSGRPEPAGERTFELAARLLRDDARRTPPVWLAPLSPARPVAELLAGAAPVPGSMPVPIATVDLPREQRYGVHAPDLAGAGGHLLVVGGPRSGRSTAVATWVLSLAATTTPEQAQVYVLDLGGGLRGLDGLPHVGSVAPRSDAERVTATLRHVLGVLRRRETEFPERGVESVADLRARRGGDLTGPGWADVVLVVDGLGELREDHPEEEPVLAEIAARGLRHGVHLVATATRWAEVRPQIRDLVPERLELRLTEPADSVIGRAAAKLVPADVPGRGLVAPGRHVQVALPRLIADPAVSPGAALREAVATVAARWPGTAAPPVRTLPRLLAPDQLALAGRDGGPGVLIGVSEHGLAPVRVPLDRDDPHLVVLGDGGSGRTSLLRTLLHGLAERGRDGHAVYVVDYRRGLTDAVEDLGLDGHATTPAAAGQLVASLGELLRARMPDGPLSREQLRDRSWWSGPEEYLVVDDADLAAEALGPLAALVPHAPDVGLHLVLAQRVAGASRAFASPLLARLRDFGSTGLVLSGDRAEGALLGGVRAAVQPPGRGVLVRRDRAPERVQTARRDAAQP